MKHHLKCPHCPRTFANSTPWALKANLANHVKGAHPEHYVAKVKVYPKGTAIPPEIDPGGGFQPTKRPYTRKPKSILDVSFCPKCGCNINAVRVAMGL